MSIWLFDLGNTRCKWTEYLQDGQSNTVFAISYDDPALFDLLPCGEQVYIASVASIENTQKIKAYLQQRFSMLYQITTQSQYSNLKIGYLQASTLGVDRFLALLAAHIQVQNSLVVSVGTALTIDGLLANGQHIGGIIAPSPTIMRESLYAKAKQLPVEGGNYRLFSNTTLDGLTSGCLGAGIALIQYYYQHFNQEYSDASNIIISGGGALELLPYLTHLPIYYRPSLVLEGLAVWVSFNTKIS